MTAIIPFTFEAATVRTVTSVTGEPLFCLSDVCAVLELSNPSMVAMRLDDDERYVLSLTDSIGREQPALFVTESGLWSVVLRSDKPQAKRFRKWLTAEVIPSIRRTGAYVLPDLGDARIPSGLEYARALVAAEERVEAERLAHAATIVETKQIIATKEGVQECIFANALAKQINQALGKALVDLKRFPRWIEQDGGEFFNRGFNEKQADSAHQLWFHVTKPQRHSAQRPGERLYDGWIIQITPIGQTKITNMVLRDKNRILPIYRSAYQNTPLRLIGGVK